MVIADTGYWLALADRRDRFHAAANVAFNRYKEPLVTTWPVVAETCHLLARCLGVDSQRLFLGNYARGGFEVFDLELSHAEPLIKLMEKYRDLPMDLADASLVLLAEELGHGRILSTDQRHFRTYRWKQRKPFENLLLA
jgi:predicted nucleic acid-binding protein